MKINLPETAVVRRAKLPRNLYLPKMAPAVVLVLWSLATILSGTGCRPKDSAVLAPSEPTDVKQAHEGMIQPEEEGTAGDPATTPSVVADRAPGTIRFATFNAAMNRKQQGQLLSELQSGESQQARKIAAIVQTARPDVLLINEFDGDDAQEGLRIFRDEYLAVGQFGQEPVTFSHSFAAAVNTGMPSGEDLNNDGDVTGPEDAFGYGAFPGQYGMVVYSRFPIATEKVRTFQRFLWRDMPDAIWPVDPESGASFYSDEVKAKFRLSSKSHWDVPLQIMGTTVHFLVCHPTPPVFDGPEDRNGRRNHDEIRFFVDYVQPDRSGYIYDDAGGTGGLAEGARFVAAGDLNADPRDGDSAVGAILQWLRNPAVASCKAPSSTGGREASREPTGANARHASDPSEDTADFPDRTTGNLRVDYVLPSANLTIHGSGVFWPTGQELGADWVSASDHRLVWMDVGL